MNINLTINGLEKSCEDLIAAVSSQDWELVEDLDKTRLDLIIHLAEIKQDSLTTELEDSINHILELDKQIQKDIMKAWNQARSELLSIQQSRPAIEMYQQKLVN
jgi:pyruvate/2-oxoacid:ferredoxin oxidoreductase beta subunit